MKRVIIYAFVGLVLVCGAGICLAQVQEKECSAFEVSQCPQNFCNVVVNCRGEQTCAQKPFDPPKCGPLAYDGQDVPCCSGLVRRCGVAFLDDTCDMFGDHSEYNLPICIPCGDGVCTNFENVCNCPEDCWPVQDRVYDGQLYDGEVSGEEKQK